MKILLGGVPFGCDNIGDEAILASVIGLVRGIRPDAELVVSTGDRAGTERKFGLKTVPLYGFAPAEPAERLREALDGVDFYIWAGATKSGTATPHGGYPRIVHITVSSGFSPGLTPFTTMEALVLRRGMKSWSTNQPSGNNSESFFKSMPSKAL